MYMGSTGDEQRVLTAKKIVTYAIIGLALILVSYSIIKVLDGNLHIWSVGHSDSGVRSEVSLNFISGQSSAIATLRDINKIETRKS